MRQAEIDSKMESRVLSADLYDWLYEIAVELI